MVCLYTGTDMGTLWRRMGRCEQGALVMMVKSSLKLSVSEVEVEEVVTCFNAYCVGYQSLWDEGENGYWGVGRKVEGVGARCFRSAP